MAKPVLYGADYSVYVRIARLALLEKGVAHELVPVDIFAADGVPSWYLGLHPFGRIPALRESGEKVAAIAPQEGSEATESPIEEKVATTPAPKKKSSPRKKK